MKTYKVKVNGKSYIVELESVEESNATIVKKETKKEEKSKSETTNVKGASEVVAPIQGNVINVLVKVGQKVKKGDVLLLIEAMKLENEVNAHVDGEIIEILVSKGQNVANNEVLIRIK